MNCSGVRTPGCDTNMLLELFASYMFFIRVMYPQVDGERCQMRFCENEIWDIVRLSSGGGDASNDTEQTPARFWYGGRSWWKYF